MDFGNLFTRAWNIVWNNKFMIVLGFLAALGAGAGSGSGGSNTEYQVGPGDVPPAVANNIERFFEQFAPLLGLLACLAVFVGIILWLVRLAAQAGLIDAAARLDAGEKVTFGEAIRAGWHKLGRMVGINILMYGPFIVLVLIVVGVVVTTAGAAAFSEIAREGTGESIVAALGFAVFCVLGLLCILFPVWIVVTLVYPFAQRGAVLADLSVRESIGHGWDVFKSNLGEILLLVLFFIILAIVFGIAAFLVLLPFAFLAFLPALMNIVAENSMQVIDILVIISGGLFVWLVGAAINSIMVSFRSTTVTLAYQEFIAKKA